MRHLTPQQTRAVLHHHGLDQAGGLAFAFRDTSRHTVYDWHAHPHHQLLYAMAGSTQIETAQARFLLPAGRAAWIPAGLSHRTLISDVDGASLFFAPALVHGGDGMRVLAATPLMREMILHALRWTRGDSERDPVAASFLRTLALLCAEWLESELPLSLPSASHPGLRRALDAAAADPGTAALETVLATAGLSERSFRRLFRQQTGLCWRDWLTQARMLKAMGLLANGARVTDAAAEVGYDSLSAFAKAFTRMTGEAPAAYRAQQRKQPAAPPGT